MTEKLQCCKECKDPQWIFVNSDRSMTAVCDNCFSRDDLRAICKGAWNINTAEFEENLPEMIQC